MFRKPRTNFLWLGLVGLCIVASPLMLSAQDSEAVLLATLADENAPIFDKAIACKQLAIMGTEAAVPVLAKLLDEEETLSHYARYALEPIPSPEVDRVLIAALSTQKGRQLIGTVNSLANRGKPEAIDALAELLDNRDKAVARAAAHSIARLGTPKAAEILGSAMSAELAPACLVCGKTLAEQGHEGPAIQMFVKLSNLENAPKFLQLAAMLQAVVLQEQDGLETLSQALTSDDKRVLGMGLRTARRIDAAGATRVALAALAALADASPSQTAQLVTLLGDLGTPAGLPAIVEAAGSTDIRVRVAALGALASLGSAEHVVLLADASTDPIQMVAAQAKATLGALTGADVDRAVLELLEDETRQATAIQLIGERRITAAVPKLLAMLDGVNQRVVVTALGETISLDQIDVLGDLLTSNSDELREAVQTAMHAACYRMPDRDATATKLAEYLNKGADTVPFVMEELRVLGGPKALDIVARAARGSNDTLKDYATRELGAWFDTSAGTVLLDLAKSEGDSKYGIRAIKGYIRLARQFSMTDAERAAICRAAMKTAGRDTEKKLVLAVLRQYPNVESLAIAIEAAGLPSLKAEATQTALEVAEQIRGNSREVKKMLAQIEYSPVKVEILKAVYGAGEKTKDVTDILRKKVRDFPMVVLSAKYNAAFGGDPAPSTPKQLTILYKIDGKPGQVTFKENAMILLPMPK